MQLSVAKQTHPMCLTSCPVNHTPLDSKTQIENSTIEVSIMSYEEFKRDWLVVMFGDDYNLDHAERDQEIHEAYLEHVKSRKEQAAKARWRGNPATLL